MNALPLGQSLVVDLHECDASLLGDARSVEGVLTEAARESGATVVSAHFHQFSPHGVSGVVIITESHFAIHSWPEHRFAAIDIFTCGTSVDLARAVTSLKRGFRATTAKVTHHIARGPNASAATPLPSFETAEPGISAESA